MTDDIQNAATVYVLYEAWPYEGCSSPLGVFSTLEAAQEACPAKGEWRGPGGGAYVLVSHDWEIVALTLDAPLS